MSDVTRGDCFIDPHTQTHTHIYVFLFRSIVSVCSYYCNIKLTLFSPIPCSLYLLALNLLTTQRYFSSVFRAKAQIPSSTGDLPRSPPGLTEPCRHSGAPLSPVPHTPRERKDDKGKHKGKNKGKIHSKGGAAPPLLSFLLRWLPSPAQHRQIHKLADLRAPQEG